MDSWPIFRLLLLLIYFAYYSDGIRDEMFTINSKLPKNCGHLPSYKPEPNLAPWGEWPWLGVLTYKGSGNSRCNVILIHPQVAITAMLCVRKSTKDNEMFVEFSNSGLPTFQKIPVSSIHSNENKFALLHLKMSVIVTEKVQPLCIWEENNDYSAQLEDLHGLMIGSDFTDPSEILRVYQVPTKIVGKARCNKSNPTFYENNLKDSICLNYFKEPVRCHHIGSALMFPRLNQNGRIVWFLRGIQTQRVWYCGTNFAPTFDLAPHRAWIERHFRASIEASCGRRIIQFTPLVTRGYEASRGDWPWHTAIYHVEESGYIYKCGGSLLSSKYILTAAHCVVKRGGGIIGADKVTVALGKHDRNVKETGAVIKRISNVVWHEEFDSSTLVNDVALLQTSTEVDFNDYIRPVCLWDDNNLAKTNIYNQVGKVPGWGVNENDQYSSLLYVATMPVVSDVICYQSHESFYTKYLTNKTLCAGNPRGNGTNVCNGDSGGGFVLPISQDDQIVTWYIRGIVSITLSRQVDRLCDPDYYVLFTDVAVYLNWIKSNMV